MATKAKSKSKVNTSNQGKWGNSAGWDTVGGLSQTQDNTKPSNTSSSKPSSSSSSSKSSSSGSSSSSGGSGYDKRTGVDHSRNQSLAGQTVRQGMYDVTYDELGYAKGGSKKSDSPGYIVDGTYYNSDGTSYNGTYRDSSGNYVNQSSNHGGSSNVGTASPTGGSGPLNYSSATNTSGATNHASDILNLINSNPNGSAIDAVKAALAARNAKITSNPNVYGKDINGIYVGDSVTQQAMNYINGYSNQFLPQNAIGNTMGQVITPNLAGTDKLGDLYGITYDQNTIRDILNRATEAEYASKDKAFGTTENKYINQAQTDQATTLQSLKQMNQQASMNGAMMGSNAATALSSILTGQQTNATNMLDLANQRNLLQTQKAEALAKNSQLALDSSNGVKQAIAGIDLSKYGYDTQQMVGQLDYLAALNDALAQIKSSQTAADATKYASDNDLAGTKYNADSYKKNTSGAGGKGATGPATGVPQTGTPDDTSATPDATATGQPIEGISGAKYKTDANGKVTVTANGKTNTVNASQLAVMQREGSVDAGLDPNKYSYEMLTNQLFKQASSGVPYAQTLWSGLKALKDKSLDKCVITLGNGNRYTYNAGQASWTSSATKEPMSTKSMLGVLTTGALSTGASISTK